MLFASKHSLAIGFDPIQLQSNAGELFYAEIKYRNVEPQTRLEVSLANAEELSSLGLPNQNHSHFNIYIRKVGDGRQGVIVLTALQPLNHSQLKLLLKIKVDNVIHFQHINSDLSKLVHNPPAAIDEQFFLPQSIADEREIALHQPTTSAAQSQLTTMPFKPLDLANAAAMTALISAPLEPFPEINQQNSAINNAENDPEYTSRSDPQYTSKNNPEIDPQYTSENNPESDPKIDPKNKTQDTLLDNALYEPKLQPAMSPEVNPSRQPQHAIVTERPPIQSQSSQIANSNINTNSNRRIDPDNSIETAPQSHLVRGSQSLSKIAQQIALSTDQKTSTVMRELKRNNKHAFIQGNPDRLRKGATLHFFLPEKAVRSITQASTEQLISTTEIP